jgi:hypothetical protein
MEARCELEIDIGEKRSVLAVHPEPGGGDKRRL